MNESEYGADPQGRPRFYGIYSAKVVDVKDPLKKNRIKVQIQQIMGTEVSNWAEACLPITSNSYHPDHDPHKGSDIAALINSHALSITTGSASAGTAHTHSVTATLTHTGNSGTLKHPHLESKTMLEKNLVANKPTSTTDSQETSQYSDATIPEHTFHRLVPAVGQLVWVMFEAGLLDHPVWMGVQS